MPITDTAKSYADTIRDAVGALSGFDREVALTTGHLTGLDVKLAAANRELNDLVFTSKRTVFGAMFKGFPESVYASRKAVADFGAEVERAAAVAKVFEVRAALAFKTPLKDFETLGKAAEKLNETLQGKLLAGFNSMKTVLVSGGGSMKHMRDALVEYNRSVYDASRLSEILGRSGVFKPQLWTTITKNTNLSKQSFADLYRELMIVNKGVTMTSTEFANLTQVMTKQFGGGVKQIAEQMQIFRQLQEDIPDLWDVIKRMRSDLAAGVDPKGMREMLLLTNQLKGNRGSDFFALMTTRVGAQNAELTRLESSMAKYQRTLDNLSVNTGQSAEQSLIFIADALSGVTEQVDKLVNAFHAVPNLIAIFTPLASVLSLALAARAGLSGLAKLGLMAGPAMGAGAMGKMRGGGRVGMAALAIGATVYGANKLWQASQKKTKPKGVEGEEDEEDTEEDAAQRRADRKTQRDTQRKMGKAQKAERAIIDAAREKYEIEEKTEGTLAYSLKIYNGIQAQVKTVTTLSNKWAESSSSIAEKLKEIGQIGPSIIDAAKQSAEATKMTYIQQEELYQAAKKNLGVELSGLDPKQKAVRMSEIAVVNAQRLLYLQKSTEASVKSSTIDQEASANLYKRQRDLLSSQADYQEKLALGMAISYNARKQVWETTVAERKELEKAVINTRKNTSEEKVLLQERFKGDAVRYKSLREFGVTQSQIDRMAEGKLSAFLEAKAAIGDKDQDAINAQTILTQRYAMMVDMQKRVVDLKGIELEQTMKIREGYMDVINEMTTGNDLVTKLIPNMTRGAMSILDVRRQMMGADFGGAMRVGFGSKQGFGAAGGAAMAPSYGPSGGLKGSLFNPATMTYRQFLDMYHGNTGAGFLRDKDIGQSAVGMLGIPGGQGPQTRPFNIGLPPQMSGGLLKTYQDGGLAGKSVVDLTATGGKIPGPSGAGRDNTFAKVGSETVMVGGGEYSIPGRSIKGSGDLDLLHKANDMGRGVGEVNQTIYNNSYAAASRNPVGARISGGFIVNQKSTSVPGMSGALSSFVAGDSTKLQDLVMGYRGGMLRSFDKGGPLRMLQGGSTLVEASQTLGTILDAATLGIFEVGWGAIKGAAKSEKETEKQLIEYETKFSKYTGSNRPIQIKAGIDEELAYIKTNFGVSNLPPAIKKQRDEFIWKKEVISDALLSFETEKEIFGKRFEEIDEDKENFGWKIPRKLILLSSLGSDFFRTFTISAMAGATQKYVSGVVKQTLPSMYSAISGRKTAEEVMEEKSRELSENLGVQGTLTDDQKKQLKKRETLDAFEKSQKAKVTEQREFALLDRHFRNTVYAKSNRTTLRLVDKDPEYRKKKTEEYLDQVKKQQPDLRPDLQRLLAESLVMERIRDVANEKTASVREKVALAVSAKSRGAGGVKGGKSTDEIYMDRARKELKQRGLVDKSQQDVILREMRAPVEEAARKNQLDKMYKTFESKGDRIRGAILRGKFTGRPTGVQKLVARSLGVDSLEQNVEVNAARDVYEREVQDKIDKLIENKLLLAAGTKDLPDPTSYISEARDLISRYGSKKYGVTALESTDEANSRLSDVSSILFNQKTRDTVAVGKSGMPELVKPLFSPQGVVDAAFRDSSKIQGEFAQLEKDSTVGPKNRFMITKPILPPPEKFSERDIELQRRRGGHQTALPQDVMAGVAPRFSSRDVELQNRRGRKRMRYDGGEISAYGIGGSVGALSQSMTSGQSSAGSTPSSASLYLTGGINVDRLYLGGNVIGNQLQSDRNSFMKELSLQVTGQ